MIGHQTRLLPGTAFVWLLTLLVAGELSAGTTGKVQGSVVDHAGDPIAGATVALVGHAFQVETSEDGSYFILSVPPGIYELIVTRASYETVRVREVIVSADLATWQHVQLGATGTKLEEVIVIAERPPVDLYMTSSQANISSEMIESLPVQELQDIVNLQAGVVDGHFRGGRLGEVQFQVDGVSVNNAYDNESILRIDRSLLQEVQVISGTFDAEYGQAMSGVVNAVLKDGTEELKTSGEVFLGGFAYGDNRLVSSESRPADIQNYQLSVSGPFLLDTVFLLSGRAYFFDDYVRGERVFAPTDSINLEHGVFLATGDGQEVPLAFSRELSGIVKLTNNRIPSAKVSYQAIFNHIEGQRANYAFRFNPDGLSEQKTRSLAHGLDWTQTFSRSTYLDLNVRQNYFKYEDFLHEDVFDPRYDAAGRPTPIPGLSLNGVELTRFRQVTDELVVKSTLVSLVNSAHHMKIGGELRLPKVQFGTPGHLTFAVVNGQETLIRRVEDSSDFPGVRTYHPHIGAAFVQDQIDWAELTLRAGVRLDYFDARSTVPSDPANPANAIEGAPESIPRRTTIKAPVSPRLGVAYPVADRAAIHFAYGHFYQFPSIKEVFDNADYRVLRNLQAGIVPAVLGNPDVKPEKTIQYEMGYRHAFTRHLGIDITTFYKDIRDLLGVEFISTYNDAEYIRLTNVDFGNVFGVTVALDHRRFGPTSIALDYTWQRAMGNSSDPRETATRAEALEDPRPRLIPFDWDQRHTFNMTLSLGQPGSYSTSAILRYTSGQPYTPLIETAFGSDLLANSGRKPSGVVVDVRAEKDVRWIPNLKVFGRVFNLFDARFFNGAVFESTGSPYYSRSAADIFALQDPTRFYPPRRIEFGIRIGAGGA